MTINIVRNTLKVLFVLIFLHSCGGLSTKPRFDESEITLVRGVPFIQQEYQYCGPSAMASVLGYYGKNIDQHEIADSVYTEELKGSLITDMKAYAVNQGFEAVVENGDIPDLKSYIDKGIPVIVLVDRGVSVVNIQHYYVVYGYVNRDEYMVINDGNEKMRFISNAQLEKEWEKMNNLMLVISNDI